jgi:hypothetical protein
MDKQFAAQVLQELVARGNSEDEIAARLDQLDAEGQKAFLSEAAQKLGMTAQQADPKPSRVLPPGAHMEREGFEFQPDNVPLTDRVSELAATTVSNLPFGERSTVSA